MKKVTTRIARPKEPGKYEDWEELIVYFEDNEPGSPVVCYHRRVMDPDYPEGYCGGPAGVLVEIHAFGAYAECWARVQDKLSEWTVTAKVETVSEIEKTTEELEDEY